MGGSLIRPILSCFGCCKQTNDDDDKQSNDQEEDEVEVFRTRLRKINKANGFTVRPEAPQMQAWDIWMLLLLGYTAVLMPFDMGFLEGVKKPILKIFNIVVDIFFASDMLVSCCLTFYDEAEGREVVNQREIRNRYLKSWFPIDFIATIPFDKANNIQGAEKFQHVFKFMRLLRILKLLRLLRVGRIIGRWQPKIGYRYTSYSFVVCIVSLITLGHWGACVWGITTQFVKDDNWIIRADMAEQAPLRQYVCALYWSMMTLTTIGYGDYLPANHVERGVGTCFCMFGGLFYAYIIGNICGTLIEVNRSHNEYITERDMMNDFLSSIEFTQDTCLQVREYFRENLHRHRRKNQARAVCNLSPGLAMKLREFQYGKWLSKIRCFQPVEPIETPSQGGSNLSLFQRALLKYLQMESFPKQEAIIAPGDAVKKMYLVNRGLMACKGRLVGRGGCVGDDIILHLIDPSARRPYYLQTLTFVDTFTLSKEHLYQVLEDGNFPVMRQKMRAAAIRLGFRRRVKKIGAERKREKWKASKRIMTKKGTPTPSRLLRPDELSPPIHDNSTSLVSCLAVPGYQKGNRKIKNKAPVDVAEELGKELDRLLWVARKLDVVFQEALIKPVNL